MSAIAPNDLVECINNGRLWSWRGGFHYAPMLTVGAVYRVAKLIPPERVKQRTPGVQLVSPILSDPRGCFALARFRPLPDRPWLAELLNVEAQESQPVTVT